jgi:FlaA1/EpsC-like NDP-sugar epimerase
MHPSEKIRPSNLFVHTYSGESDPVGESQYIIGKSDLILVTGASGFIGSRVVHCLLNLGFRNVRCLVRPSDDGLA